MQQVDVAPYRLDFALLDPAGVVRLCIETDGHLYHGSPEQAEHDRKRDRRLLVDGWLTIRFAAREILRDPIACARTSLETFAQLRAQRGPGLAKTKAPERVEASEPASGESSPRLVDHEAAWQQELEAAQRVSDGARKRHGIG